MFLSVDLQNFGSLSYVDVESPFEIVFCLKHYCAKWINDTPQSIWDTTICVADKWPSLQDDNRSHFIQATISCVSWHPTRDTTHDNNSQWNIRIDPSPNHGGKTCYNMNLDAIWGSKRKLKWIVGKLLVYLYLHFCFSQLVILFFELKLFRLTKTCPLTMTFTGRLGRLFSRSRIHWPQLIHTSASRL